MGFSPKYSYDVEHCSGNNAATSSSRYDPRGISRIRNINDLVDDETNSDDEDDDEEIIAPPRHNSSGVGHNKGVEGGSSNSNHRSRYRGSSRNRLNVENAMPSLKDFLSSSSHWFSSTICPSPARGRSWWGVDLSTLDISRQQVILLFSLVGIIIVSSVGIGYAVVGPSVHGDKSTAPLSDEGVTVIEVDGGQQQEVEEIVGLEEGATADENEQQLFQIAEQVITACAESMLDVDMSECQSLCHSKMCCFEDESERYSCVDDAWKHCVVYAACENLLGDFPLDEIDHGSGGGRRNR